jgi:hypothetical protein
MSKRAVVLSLFALGLALAWPAGSTASAPNNQAASYQFLMEAPNVATASNGDTIAITGEGAFAVHPKSASGGGEFTHSFAGGGSVSGTWRVNRLVDFQPWGCGVVFGMPLPPNLCGGRVSLDVTFTGPAGSFPGRITIFCVIGSPPPSVEEGVHVVVPGVDNFNKQVSGMNVYVKQ